MTARQIGIAGRFRQEQRRILNNQLVRTVALADPKFVRALLVPGNAGFGSIDIDHEHVLAARRHLADRVGSACPAAEVGKQDRATIFGLDRHRNIVEGLTSLPAKVSIGPLGRFRRFVERSEIGA